MRAILLFVAAALGACASNPSPVPVRSARTDLDRLAGRWEGEYSSSETGRSGSIVFTLLAGRDTAAGDVLMIPKGTEAPLQPAEIGGRRMGPVTSPEVITIRFVQIQGDRIRGEMDPYRGPGCNCTLSTTFTGTVRGERIDGTFTTIGAGGAGNPPPSAGRWSVRRKG